MSSRSFSRLYRMLSGFIALCLLSADLTGAASLIDFPQQDPIGAPIAVTVTPAAEQALFRTTVALRQPRHLSRVRDMGAVVLEAGEASALLLVTADQLADLARLRFAPTASDELGTLVRAAGPGYEWLLAEIGPTLDQAAEISGRWSVVNGQSSDDEATSAADSELVTRRSSLVTLLHAITPGQRAAIVTLAPVDSDNDGLTDTQEGWWCTNPAVANSDGTGADDGAEIVALLDFTLSRAVRWGHGAPFGPPAAWPDFNNRDNNPNTPACNDGDYDTIPDFAEVFMVGSRVPEETTDLDKFDDGQELFGTTFCPGGTASCDYGSYPRIEYWNFIKAGMPSWVQPPGDNLFVAAFPEPEVSVVAGSWTVERVTTITTSEGVMAETSNSYATTVTEGQGSSIADTRSWNDWEEVSESVETPLGMNANLTNASNSNWNNRLWGATQLAGGVGLAVGGEALCIGAGIAVGGPIGGALAFGACGAIVSAIGGAIAGEGWSDLTSKDEIQAIHNTNKYNITNVQSYSQVEQSNMAVQITQPFDTQGFIGVLDGVQYAIGAQGALLARGLQDVTHAINQPRFTETHTSGRSWGGAQTTTHETYEEHAITNGQQFTTGQNWSTAWAVDSAHAADLRFTYRVDNTGTEYFREMSGLIFNIYLGDDTTPLVSYPAWQQFANGKIENFFPADAPKQFASTPVPLTLEQMKRIDLGEKLTIVVEDFSFGADENFYNDAINGGLEVLIEDGTADGNETVDRYVIPTWGVESVQDALTRAFPATEDAQGNLIALQTAEFNGTQPPVWNEYALSDIAWWNVYQSCATDCANVGATPLQEQQAQAGSSILFRFNRDSDRDGYKDNVEWRYGTDPNDPAKHPFPEMLAGFTLTRSGNLVTGLLKLQNNGSFDAYGIDAVIYAPDDTVTITNNTVGGNGRVRAGAGVAVGALIQPPVLANMGNSTAKVYARGSYVGSADRVYTFTVQNAGVVGAGNTSMTWSDGAGGSGTLQLGSAYHAPLPLAVANGLEVGLDSGTLPAGARFSVQTLIPRDTFKFTVNSEPYTPPVVVVSYSDPQGSHRFVTPVLLPNLEADLNAYSGQMLPGIGLTISANGAFNSSNNATDFILNSPDGRTIEGAKLYLDFVSDGKLVKEIVQTFDQPPGPTVRGATWSAADFNNDYHPNGDNILLAFWTDAQDNIIDSAARPFNTFQDDPTAVLEVEAEVLTWNFGTAAQGTLLQHPLLIGNTGRQALLLRAGVANGVALVGPQTVDAGGLGAYALVLDTTPLAVGPYSRQVTIRTSDPARPEVTVNVSGTIAAGVPDSGGGGLARPLDWPATIPGSGTLGDHVSFTHELGPNPETLHPVRVWSEDYEQLWGVGNHATDFLAGTAPGDMFGDGRDGVMPASGNLDNNNGVGFGSVIGSSGSTTVTVTDYHNIGRVNPGDVVLIHQTQYTGAGNWELNRAISDFTGSGAFTLQKPLQFTYSTGAQIVRVPQYSTCNITGTITPRSGWNGTWGGILAVMCNGPTNISGSLNATGMGFRGGSRRLENSPENRGHTGEGYLGFYNSLNVDCWAQNNSRGNGGGSGHGQVPDGWGVERYASGGGGGSYQTAGGNGLCHTGTDRCWCVGNGASPIGASDLSTVFLGGGGGGGGAGKEGTDDGGAAGNGGGFIYLSARQISVVGNVQANGTGGQAVTGNDQHMGAGGGGGAGGAIFLRGGMVSLSSGTTTAFGGSGGASGSKGGGGGAGGTGRVYAEYCESVSGTTFPSLVTNELNCHIAEQSSSESSEQGQLTLPESFPNGRTYAIQYGRRFVHAAAGEQTSTLRVPAGVFNSATLHALVSGVGSGDVTFRLDVGDDGTWDWQTTQAVANAADLPSADLAAAFNAYWSSHGAPSSGTLDVPVRVSLSKPGQVLLTDLQMTTGGSSLRYVRLPANSYGSVALDLTVAGSGSGSLTLAADIGDDGTVDWSYTGNGPFPRALTTDDLSAAVNAYMAGKSGDVDVPVRLTYTPFNGIGISNAAAAPAAQPDGAIANADVTLTHTNLTEGDTTTVNATIRSSGAAIDGITVGFFASLPNGLDWYLGSRYLPSVSPSGTQTSLVWDTTGFTGASTVRAIIDPYKTLAETNENNNEATKTATIKTRPNLRVTAVAPATLFPMSGETMTVDVAVQNSGQSPSAAATCSLYLGNPDDGGALIGSQVCGPLGANTTVIYTFQWTPAAVGPARIFARADSGGALSEPDELDNDRWLDLDVADPGPMPPHAPSAPTPADNAAAVPVDTNLGWTGGDPNPGNTVTYKVYLDTVSPPAMLKITQSATTYDPPADLAPCTTYFWRIVATDNTNRTTNGPVWRFDTYCPTNAAPNAPTNPNPAGGASGVAPAAALSWTGSDPENDPLTYEVRFGASNPPPTAVASQSAAAYDPSGNMAAHTTYYWQIVARDAAHPGGTPGPVWSFTTLNTAPTAPGGPNPAGGATNVPGGTQVCWSAVADADGDALVYDVAFGTSNPPAAATTGQNTTCYDPPGDLAAGVSYYWKVTARDAFGSSAPGPVWSFTTAGGGGVFPDVFYLSTSANATLGGIAAQGVDILRYIRSTNTWAIAFDGSDHGLTKNVTAFALLDNGSLLLVFSANQIISGMGTATPYDVVKFTPNAPGSLPLGAGTFSPFFQGQLHELTASAEKIDAIDYLAAGNRLLLSTSGAAKVTNSGGVLKAADEDVFVFDRDTNTYESALLIDGSKVTGLGSEDISGIWDDPNSGNYYITITGAFNLGGVKGNSGSIVKLSPNGGTTVYTPSLVDWWAPGTTLPKKTNLDGLELGN